MNAYRSEDSSCCYFHPKEVFVGICPLCLSERLLILAANQGNRSSARAAHRNEGTAHKKPPINLPKIFAFGSLLSRLEFRNWNSNNTDHDAKSTSQEDSFISIKFEDNGAASWEKGTVSKVFIDPCSNPWNQNLNKEAKQDRDITETTSVIEQAKPHASLRWRRGIGHMFQLIRWKRSNKGHMCHVGTKVEGVKVRTSWIRSLRKRRTKE
ncbi:transcriptional regulatory protein [Salix suchowensis]|nr:transcriptional regulatory protein [Salix suchowensis]